MTCPVCGRWGAADQETGYDADGICPECARQGWTELANGEIVREERIAVGPVPARDVVECGDMLRDEDIPF